MKELLLIRPGSSSSALEFVGPIDIMRTVSDRRAGVRPLDDNRHVCFGILRCHVGIGVWWLRREENRGGA